MGKNQAKHLTAGQSCRRIIICTCHRVIKLVKKEPEKVSEETAKEFLKKMGHPEVEVIKKLKEAPPQIFILDLILASKAHHHSIESTWRGSPAQNSDHEKI